MRPHFHKQSPLIFATTCYISIGYALYFFSWMVPEPPIWAGEIIHRLAGTVNALRIAGRVSARPFPAQVTIIYCVVGSILLTLWFTYWLFLMKDARELYVKKTIKKNTSRIKLMLAGCFMLSCSILLYPMILFVLKSNVLTWRSFAFFSPTFGSATLLLICGFVPAINFPIALCAIYSAIAPRHIRSD